MDLLSGMATFARVVDAGSLTRAARGLRVSTAAVSRQLAWLERELGVALLVRTTRSLAFTDEGRRFYPAAQRALAEVDDARRSVRRDGAVAGVVTVSVPYALGVDRLDASLLGLLRRHPGLRVDLRLEDRVVDLVADGVDLAIRAGIPAPDSASIIAHPIATLPRVVVAAPRYLRAHGEPRHPAQLARHTAVVHLSATGGGAAWELVRGADTCVVEVSGRLRATALPALRAAAIAGGGIALLPRVLVERALARRELRALALGGWAPRAGAIVALHRTELRAVPRIAAVLAHLRAGDWLTDAATAAQNQSRSRK